MITTKFSPLHKLKKVEVFTFETYKQFFEFYTKHKNKGCIFDVKDDRLTK